MSYGARYTVPTDNPRRNSENELERSGPNQPYAQSIGSSIVASADTITFEPPLKILVYCQRLSGNRMALAPKERAFI